MLICLNLHVFTVFHQQRSSSVGSSNGSLYTEVDTMEHSAPVDAILNPVSKLIQTNSRYLLKRKMFFALKQKKKKLQIKPSSGLFHTK